MLPDELDARLRYEARRRAVTLADLVREAVGEYLVPPADESRPRLGFTAIGAGPGTGADHDHDREVRRAIDADDRAARAGG